MEFLCVGGRIGTFFLFLKRMGGGVFPPAQALSLARPEWSLTLQAPWLLGWGCGGGGIDVGVKRGSSPSL